MTETVGDLNLASPVSITTGNRTRTPVAATASVQSDLGNVTLTSTTGSIRDAYNEALVSNPILVANMTAREQLFFNSRLSSGAITAQQLSNPLTAEMTKFLYPHTVFATQPAPLPPERANIRGNVVTLIASTSGAEIGSMGDRISIANPNNFSALPAAQANLLALSTPSDVIGVQYATYRYLGNAQSAVDLTTENFGNTARWQRISANILTGPSDALPINRTLSVGQRVLVEFNTQDYGLYEYKGASGVFDLVTQNYRDASRWQKIIGAAATDGGPANLTTGMLVTSKYTIDAMTVRRVDDVNIEASGAIVATAHNRVALESTGDSRLQRVVAGSDVQVTSAADILDVGLGTAAIASGGQVRLSAAGKIAGVTAGLPLRTQIAPAGSLITQSGLLTTVQQVAADTVINGVSTAINSLFVPRSVSGGALAITVTEGDLSIGALTSSTSVELVANGSILMRMPMAWADR